MSIEEDNQRCRAAAHAMQTGVAMKMDFDPNETTPKHLRVGVNAAMSDQGGLAALLIAKGLITREEYHAAMADAMEREAASYQREIQAHFGDNGPQVRLA